MRTILIVCLAILTSFCLITLVHLTVYRFPQDASIARALNATYDGPTDDGDGRTDGDIVRRRDRIVRLRRRLGIGLDSLPTVRFSSNRTTKAGDDDDDDDDDERADAAMRERQSECLGPGLYLGPDDDYTDCRVHCGLTDGVDYRFYSRVDMLLNGRLGRAGGYCVPNDAAACNTNTSLVLRTRDGWRCLSQTRAFGGEGGNAILACDGSLLDRATGRIWRGHIDPTLAFDSIDERLPGREGGYRFVCPPGAVDDIGNAMIPAPFDRFVLLRNACASMIPRADTNTIRPNFESGECECGGGGGDDDAAATVVLDRGLGVCVPAEPLFRADTLESALRDPDGHGDEVTPCVDAWNTRSGLTALLSSDADESSPSRSADERWRDLGLRPCGGERDSDGARLDSNRPGVARTYAMTFDRAVPSPYAMLES